MFTDKDKEVWQNTVYLVTAEGSMEAELIEAQLRSENIPCLKKAAGSSSYLKMFMGANTTIPIDIYVDPSTLEDAQNIIIPIDQTQLVEE